MVEEALVRCGVSDLTCPATVRVKWHLGRRIDHAQAFPLSALVLSQSPSLGLLLHTRDEKGV